jgi:hypothetical protein
VVSITLVEEVRQRGARRGWRDWEKVRVHVVHDHVRVGIYAHKAVPLLSEQSDPRVFGGHLASMGHAGGSRIPSPGQVEARSRRTQRTCE